MIVIHYKLITNRRTYNISIYKYIYCIYIDIQYIDVDIKIHTTIFPSLCTGPTDKCHPCGAPPELEPGQIDITQKASYQHGETVAYSSSDNYVIQGSAKTCDNGRWMVEITCHGKSSPKRLYIYRYTYVHIYLYIHTYIYSMYIHIYSIWIPPQWVHHQLLRHSSTSSAYFALFLSLASSMVLRGNHEF